MLHLEVDRASPLILIFSEDEATQTDPGSLSTAHELLGSDLLAHPATAVINCNRIAATYMLKALELVIKKEARQSHKAKQIPLSTLRPLANIGDIRSAIGLLQIMCTADHRRTQVSQLPTKRSFPGPNKEAVSDGLCSLEASGRETSVSLFHAIGKVVYNKRERTQAIELDQHPASSFKHHYEMISKVDVEEIVRLLGSDTDTFIAGLQENYVPSCEAQECLAHVDTCALELSTADLLSASCRARTSGNGSARTILTTVEQVLQQELKTQAAIRGLLYSLPYPVRRVGAVQDGNASKLNFPASMRLPKREVETLMNIERWLRMSIHNAGSASLQSSISLPVSGGVTAWATFSSLVNTINDSDESISNIPLTTPGPMTGLPNRTDMILTQMPYLSKIISSKAPTHDLHVLRQIVEVRNPSSMPLSSGSVGNGIRSQDHGELSGSVSDKLYLSDDDIEDF